MPTNKYSSRTVFVICLLLLATVGPLAAATASESDRLEKLERAVEQLQKRNAELEAEVSSLKAKQTAVVPEGKMKTKIISEGKTYVEKVVEEKLPLYVQQRGPELKLVLGGFIQVNFEDGDVSAFEGRFGQTAIEDRFRLRRARINLTGDYAEQFDFKWKAILARAMAPQATEPPFRQQTFGSTIISFQQHKLKSANIKRHLAWSS